MSNDFIRPQILIRLADKFEINPVFLEKDWYTQQIFRNYQQSQLV